MRVNYVIASWGGARRGDRYSDKTPCGRGDYLKKQIASLRRYRHSLTQVTIVNSRHGGDYPELASVPPTIGGVPVVVLEKENTPALSLGSWREAVRTYQGEFDYYIFVEDDYVFIRDDFDRLLIEMHRTRGDGHLMISHCEDVFRYNRGNGAIVLNGIVDSKALEMMGFDFDTSQIVGFLSSFRITSFDARYLIPYLCKFGIVYFGGEELMVVPTQMVDVNADIVLPESYLDYNAIPQKHRGSWLRGLHT